jgi:hypothetical protein
MNKVIAFKVQENFRIWIQFQDGESKTIDFEPLIGKGVSAPLLDKEYFKLVSIDAGGGLEWPNGMDFCPNYLKEYSPELVSAR